jgi:ABC-2 type transport system ATP-binding protein
MDSVIATHRLTKLYGRRWALSGLNLDVRRGEIFGFLGPNGSGKSTTIRILLDIIRPTAGIASVLGATPRSGGPALRRRIGYLPGDFVTDGGQSAKELLTHLCHLRGGAGATQLSGLAERFGLDLHAPVRSLSRGNRQKVGIIQAFAHEPELLILDEPTSGLDPLQQGIFVDLVREARARGQTILMSSHILSEIQRVADRVGIIRDGRMLTVEAVGQLRHRSVRRVEMEFGLDVPQAAFTSLSGVTDVRVDGSVLRCRLAGDADALIKASARYPVETIVVREPDLDELFLSYYHEAEESDAA